MFHGLTVPNIFFSVHQLVFHGLTEPCIFFRAGIAVTSPANSKGASICQLQPTLPTQTPDQGLSLQGYTGAALDSNVQDHGLQGD